MEQHLDQINPNTAGDKSGRFIGRNRGITITPTQRTGPDEAFEEIKAAAARDALLEEVAKSRLENRKRPFATPIHSPSAISDIAARMAPSSHTLPSAKSEGNNHIISSVKSESNNVAHRTASMDSTASSLSSSASQTFKQSQTAPQGNITPQDIGTLIQSAGSPEAAILRLLQEKQSNAAHTDQMWRIMEKQRTMIFGLKSDVERAVKDKDKYRKKLKEQLALSAAGNSLASALKQSTTSAREESQSPTAITASNMASYNLDDASSSRKPSDATDISTLNEVPSRSSTPQHVPRSPSLQDSAFAEMRPSAYSPTEGLSSKLPHAPLSASSLHQVTTPEYRMPTGTPPLTPKLRSPPQSPRTPKDFTETNPMENIILMSSPQGFSSPKERSNGLSRRAPPAPLNLSPQPSPRQPFSAAQASDSDYDDNASDQDVRGRQKTRADDDRQREAFAVKEHRSRSKKDKKTKSKSVPPALNQLGMPEDSAVEGMSSTDTEPASPRIVPAHTMGSMISHLRAVSDVDTTPKPARTVTAPSILSPGLPMSPRPGDRSMNFPVPRAPKQSLSGMPMSPRDGAMPLSPRPPRAPIPLPPQTPIQFERPNMARAEAYQQLNSPAGSQLTVPGRSSPDFEQPAQSTVARSPGDIYRGLVSEQYPGLLLPPNALPSIFVKVDSSRLRPSRNSYMGPRQSEENPVFTLAIFARSDDTQLWRVEKTLAALSVFDQQVKMASSFKTKLPDRGLFTGHAPARIDARRLAMGAYFDTLLDTPMNDQAATIVCGFLTADAFSAEEGPEYFPKSEEPSQPIQIPVPNGRPRKDGYLTKRGKNFGGWKARYFVLDGPQLKYFEAPGGALLGSIKLTSAQIGKQSTAPQGDEDVDNQYRHAFLILEPKRRDSNAHVRHVLCAESDEERDAWVDCMLQYVDDDTDPTKLSNLLHAPNEMMVGGRSPRLQKSLNDLNRPSSSGKDSSTQGSLRSIPYQQTVAAEAPIMGAPASKGRDTPSPPIVGSPIFGDGDEDRFHSHPAISGPTNAVVIQDAQSWGNKPVQTPVKDKKRSIFGFGGSNRGRSSSDTAAGTSSHQPNDRPGGVRPVFGVPLVEAVEFSAPIDVPVLLPAVAYRCIEYLKERNAKSEEGIFRVSGSNVVIKALRERFNAEGDIDLLACEQNYDVHAVASLLKQYLRELPANLLTRDLHFEFLSTQEKDEKAKLEACNVLVNRLPPVNREMLEALAGYLREIVDNEPVNKMSVRNGESMTMPTPCIYCC